MAAGAWAMLAMATLQIGMSLYQQEQMKEAAEDAQEESQAKALQTAAEAQRQTQKERRQAQGAGTLAGSEKPMTGRSVSELGSILGTSNQQKRSLLGG